MLEDIQFLTNEIGPKLSRFHKVKRNVWAARCPFCGDSKTDRTKTRFYIFDKKGKLFCYCHNCPYSRNFTNFVWDFDQSLYSKYLLEKFSGRNKYSSPEPNEESFKSNVKERLDTSNVARSIEEHNSNILSHLEGPISTLDNSHEAYHFVVSKRQIPREYWNQLYYTSNYKKFINTITPGTFENEWDNTSRLVIPFFDADGRIQAMQGRSIGESKVKYLTHKVDDTASKIFGLDGVNESETVYVFEGPIDSMFVDNSVAAAGADLSNVQFDDMVYIFDNEPRNENIIKLMDKRIKEGYKVYIPPKWILEKDINDMILNGYTKSDIKDIIDNNTFSGSKAKIQFTQWKKK